MTTEDKNSFETRLYKANPYNEVEVCSELASACFDVGAIWAREETIREILGLLRSGEAALAPAISPRDFADWLESKLAKSVHPELTNEAEVKLKDPIFKWPDDTL